MEASYRPENYWSDVAAQIRSRNGRADVAGTDDPYFRHKRNKFLSRFLARLEVENRVVAELGCGPGGNLAILAKRGPQKLFGLDISQSMLELAAAATEPQRSIVELKKTDGMKLPLPDQSVDLAYTVTVLQHTTDPTMFQSLVAELCRISRDRVVLMEDTGDEEDPVSATRDHIPRKPRLYQNTVERHGFRAVKPPEFLELRASRWLYFRAWKLAPEPVYGSRAPLRVRGVMGLGMIVTRVLDRIIPEVGDLTRMEFRRVLK
jgi:SAM-dependent methyltransferase